MHTAKEMIEYLIYLSQLNKVKDKQEAVKRTGKIIRNEEGNNADN